MLKIHFKQFKVQYRHASRKPSESRDHRVLNMAARTVIPVRGIAIIVD